MKQNQAKTKTTIKDFSSPICGNHEYVVKQVFKTYVQTQCRSCGTVKNFEIENGQVSYYNKKG